MLASCFLTDCLCLQGASHGIGIRLVRHLSEITPWLDSGIVIQKYIETPATLQGHKFDVRLWALVTGWAPYTIRLAPASSLLLRRAAARFDLTEEGLASENTGAHICNTSAAKRGRGRGKGHETGDQAATLWSEEDYTTHVYMHHESSDDGARAVRRWREHTVPAMHSAACAALLSSDDLGPPHLQQQLEQQQGSGGDGGGGDRSKCFAWLGLDFGVGEDGSAWLLEVNAAPELGIASASAGNGGRGATAGVKERALAPLLTDLRRICADRLTQLRTANSTCRKAANAGADGVTSDGCDVDDDDAAAAEMLLRSMAMSADGEATAGDASGDDSSGGNGWVVAYEAPLSASLSSKSGGGHSKGSSNGIFRSDASPLECVGKGLGCGGSLGMAEQGVERWTAASALQRAAARWLARRRQQAEHEWLSAVAAAADDVDLDLLSG